MKKPDPKHPEPHSTVSDNCLRQFVGYNMKIAFLRVRDDMAHTLEPMGLRMMTFSALGIIVENPDITQTQLSLALQIERSGVVVLVDELENADLISRNRVVGDRRSYALRATLAGQKRWQEAEADVRAHEAALLVGLNSAERDILRDLLGRIAVGAAG